MYDLIFWIFVSRDTHVERVAPHRSEQRMTEITRLQRPSCSRSWHRNMVDCRRERLHEADTACNKGIWLGNKPRAHCWNKEWRNGSEKTSQTGTDETFRNFMVARKTRSTPGPGTKIDARSTRQMTNQAVQVTVLLRRLITNTSSEWNSAAREHSSSSSDQFQKSTADSDECECSCNAHTRLFCRRRLFKAQLKSTSPTKRAAETTTLDVPPQAKRPRVEGSTFEV